MFLYPLADGSCVFIHIGLQLLLELPMKLLSVDVHSDMDSESLSQDHVCARDGYPSTSLPKDLFKLLQGVFPN